MCRALVVGFLALPATPSLINAAEKEAGVDVRTNLTYYSGEGADKYRHRLDLYLPKGQRDVPVMMFVHGGGLATSYAGRVDWRRRTEVT